MKVTGSCHCGQIRFEAEVDPGKVRLCHCTDCQKLTGSAYRANVPSEPGTFKLTGPAPKTYIKTSDSGTKRAHAFCSVCGTPIYSADPVDPKTYSLRVGTLDRRAQLRPSRQIWCQSALPWSMNVEAVPRVNRQ